MMPSHTKNRRPYRGFSLLELLVVLLILSFVTAIVGQIVVTVGRQYERRRTTIQAQNNGRTALDLLVRLLRMAGNDPMRLNFVPVMADPDNNAVFDSVRIRSDWNLPDGLLIGPREDILFFVNNGILFSQEAGQLTPLEFVEGIDSMRFNYFDANNNPIADPVAQQAMVASVDIELRVRVPDGPPIPLRSSATLRRREPVQ